MNNFKDHFINSLLQNDSVTAFKLLLQFSNKNFICCVEGKDDKDFYSHILHEYLNINKNEILYEACDGKDGVLLMHNIYQEKKSVLEKKVIFIVDQDYKPMKQDELNSEVLIILPYYSFENVYFFEDNLEIVFNAVYGKNYFLKLHDFKQVLSEYIDYILDYLSCKKIIVSKVKKISLESFEKKFEERNIHFKNNKLINLEGYSLDDILKLIKREDIINLIKNNFELEKDYLNNHPELIIGKMLFRLLISYLRNDRKVDIKKQDLFFLSKKLDLKLNLNEKGA